ncbi:MAG: hypothetical protein OEW35_19440, partial [Gammaproteobacteria bacterium]|nr:hypothetical protein [Gammaproteobacteria bacterium]
YIVGYVIWDLAFGSMFDGWAGGALNVNRPEPLLWAEIVGLITYALLLTTVIDKGASVADAAKRGALTGLLLWATADFMLYSFQDVWTMPAPLVDSVLEAVRGGICGAAIAAVLAKTGN